MQAHQSKKENALIKAKREIATLLSEDKEQSARIKVEAVLREEDLIRVMEWLQMMCDLIATRIKQIDSAKECPTDLLESVCTLLYCAKRIDIPELTVVGGQFQAKWGNKWFEANIENRSGRVSKQVCTYIINIFIIYCEIAYYKMCIQCAIIIKKIYRVLVITNNCTYVFICCGVCALDILIH